jgi:hypothetical protein
MLALHGLQGLGGFNMSGSVALPTSSATSGEFAGLQRAVNDYISRNPIAEGVIAVDGKIGPRTLAATQAVLAHIGSSIPGAPSSPSSTSDLAKRARAVGVFIAMVAGVAFNTAPVGSAVVPAPIAPAPGGAAPPAPRDRKPGDLDVATIAGVGLLIAAGGLLLWKGLD